MYFDKEKLATHLLELTDNIILETTSGTSKELSSYLTVSEKAQLVDQIVHNLPSTSLENVKEFADTFDVPKESGYDISTFTQSMLRVRLLLEEVIELAAALGISKGEMYSLYIELQEKVYESNIPVGIKSVLDALVDIDYVNNGAVIAFNLESVFEEATHLVHDSNMSKAINSTTNLERIKELVDELKESNPEGVITQVVGKKLVFKNKATGKILKPSVYRPVDLTDLLIKELNHE